MRLLALEAAGPGASVALGVVSGDGALEVIGARRDEERDAGDRLLAHIEGLLARADLDVQDLHAIAVDRGPGSFVGVRTAVAAARGLALAARRPVFAVTRFELLASTAELGPDETLVIALPAGRGQVLLQAFSATCRPWAPPRLAAGREALAGLPRPLAVIDGDLQLQIDASAGVRRFDRLAVRVDATALLRLAAGHVRAGLAPIPGSELQPLYSRPPDAVPPRRLIERPDDLPPAHARPQTQ